jgi:hypothetical protein
MPSAITTSILLSGACFSFVMRQPRELSTAPTRLMAS